MHKSRLLAHLKSHRYARVMSASCNKKIIQNSFKDIVKPEKISPEFWKKILWVALDLKQRVLKNDKVNMNLLDTKHVTLLFTKPHGRFELSFTLACDLLGAKKTLYLDPYFENQTNPKDGIRVLSHLTDMFITHGIQHDILVRVIEDALRPIYPASCNAHCFQKALSDLMTYFEEFHCLKNLTLAWIGPPIAIFNSYLLLCSAFGIDIQYTCICLYGSGRMSPVHRFQKQKEEQLANQKENKITEFKTVKEAIKGAQIISTSMHPDEENQITLKAVILISLKKYEPKIKMPDFDGVET